MGKESKATRMIAFFPHPNEDIINPHEIWDGILEEEANAEDYERSDTACRRIGARDHVQEETATGTQTFRMLKG